MLTKGNRALIGGEFIAAISYYIDCLVLQPGSREQVEFNLAVARRRYRSSRRGQQPRIAVCGWELAHNPAGRVRTLADIYAGLSSTEIIGAVFPQWGTDLWPPIRNSPMPCRFIRVQEESGFAIQALHFVRNHPFDLVHLSKPRFPNILFGLLYKLLWDSRVLVDIDDEELGFVQAGDKIDLESYLAAHGSLPAFRSITGKDWTRLGVGLSDIFDGITTSNPALQSRYGGTIIPHAREAQSFSPTWERRAASRARFGIPGDKTVALFFGTPRRHKGLVRTAEALAQLGRDDIWFVIVGDFPDPRLKAELDGISGVHLHFLGGQPYDAIPDVLAVGDFCVLMPDDGSLITEFQVPAKLTDALAMGVVTFTQPTAPLRDFVARGAVIPVTPETVVETVKDFLQAPERMDKVRRAARNYFLQALSADVCREIAMNYLRGSPPLPALTPGKLSDPRQQRLFDALGGWDAFRLSAQSSAAIKEISAADHPSIVVYSVLVGDYEEVKEPAAVDPNVRYILFTDNPNLKSEHWEIVQFDTRGLSPRRASRLPKLLPHRYLPVHDISVYIDASLELKAPDVAAMVDECLEGHDIALYRHYKRDCVYEEIDFVMSSQDRVVENPADCARALDRYAAIDYPRKNGLFENALIVRRDTPKIRELDELWWAEYERGAERDQFTFMYALWVSGVRPTPIKSGKQFRDNPYVNFYKHKYIVYRETKAAPYIFVAYAPPTYAMNLGRCYNEYMERLQDGDFAIFIDHDAMFLTDSAADLIRNAALKQGRQPALFTVTTNRINNPYQRLSLLEHNHSISDQRVLARVLEHRYGAGAVECAELPSSSGVVLGLTRGTWKRFRFRDGFLKVDNYMHIAMRQAGEKVLLLNGVYVYHFYRADDDHSHAIRDIDALPRGNARGALGHVVRNFVYIAPVFDEFDRYMNLLSEGEYGVFIPNMAVFCTKDWYPRICRSLERWDDIGFMIFNDNALDDGCPMERDVRSHKRFAGSLLESDPTDIPKSKLTGEQSLRAFLVSKKTWNCVQKSAEGGKLDICSLEAAAAKAGQRTCFAAAVYAFDSRVDHRRRVAKGFLEQRMNVAVLTLGFWPQQAGMEMMVHNLASQLTEAGDNVVLFAPKPKTPFNEISHRYAIRRFSDFSHMKDIFRQYQRSMPFDVLYVQGAHEPATVALELRRECGVPVVLRTHGEDVQVDSEVGYGYRLNAEKDRLICENIRGVDHNIVIGPHMLEEVRNITAGEVSLVFNGVDTDHFVPGREDTIHRQLGLAAHTKILLAVGRNVKKKSLHLAVDALVEVRKKVPDVVLVHIGKEGNGVDLGTYARERGAGGSFFQLGEISYFEMPKFYRSAEIFVFPSKAETFGNVTVEAMACGLPCVEFDYVVNREKITDGESGFVVPYGCIEEMAQKILYLLEDEETRAAFAKAARSRAERRFSWASVCPVYRRIFQSAARNGVQKQAIKAAE